MPNICDPGENLVRKAKANGIDVICIQGPCAAINALISSGMPSSTLFLKVFYQKKNLKETKFFWTLVSEKKLLFYLNHPIDLINYLKN